MSREPLPPHAPAAFWTSRPAAVTTPPLRGLGATFRIEAEDATLEPWLTDTFAALVDTLPAGTPGIVYRLAHDRASGRHALYGGDERLALTRTRSRAVQLLLWHVNRLVVRESGAWLLLHAAAAKKDGVRVVLPAAGESGKTTTVAGLVGRGFDYLTDEVAALDPATLRLHPFRKALAVDRGSWPLLPSLAPAHRAVSTQWQVAAPPLRDPDPGAPDLVLSPRYARGTRTRLERLSPAEGLLLLSQCTFGFVDDPRRLFAPLATLARSCPAYVLHIGELDAALDLVEEAVASCQT